MSKVETTKTKKSAESDERMATGFAMVVQAFGVQALMACGIIKNPITDTMEEDPNLAAYHISVLEILEEKTQGNLTDEESQMLGDILGQVKLAHQDMTKSSEAK